MERMGGGEKKHRVSKIGNVTVIQGRTIGEIPRENKDALEMLHVR